MAKVMKSQGELIEDLVIQLNFLSNSALNFDKGNYYEAQRIATVLRILLRETKKQHSLLSQIGIRDKLYFLSTSHGYDEKNLFTDACLLMMRMKANESGVVSEYRPGFDNLPNMTWRTTEKWWDEIIIVDNKRSTFTRQKIVLYLSDQDGGAHVDPGLDEIYYDLRNNNSLAWISSDDQGNLKPLDNNPAHMTVRQICYEFMTSIKKSTNPILKQLDLSQLYIYDKNICL